MEKLIKYFISFNFRDKEGRTGFGHMELTRSSPIKNSDSIQGICKYILENEKTLESIAILNWKRFED